MGGRDVCDTFSRLLHFQPLPLGISNLTAADREYHTDAESLQITYDPSSLAYTTLLEFFYKMHDPTTKNRQGGDSGTQYRSAIFYHNEEQEQQAKKVTEEAQKQWWKSSKITTEILPAGQWWDAEDYHQRYLDVNPGGYECPAHFIRNFAALKLDE